jgi:hypothetical protein
MAGVLMLAANTVWAAPVDLTGVWERYPPLHDPAANPNAIFAEGFGNPGGAPKLREPFATQYEEYEKKSQAAEESGHPLPTPSDRCLPMGMPMMMSAIMPLEIVGRRGEVVILAEELAEIRRIYLNDQLPSLPDVPPSFRGYSVGRWEGDTLVVETEGIREDVRYLDIPHSADMKIIERFRLVSPDMLEDRVLIEDPRVLAQPYRVTFRYKRSRTYKIQEYVCTDNHYHVNAEGKVIFDLGQQH